jgi:hypothetical protein
MVFRLGLFLNGFIPLPPLSPMMSLACLVLPLNVRLADIHKPTVRFSETLYCAPLLSNDGLTRLRCISQHHQPFQLCINCLSCQTGSLFKSLYLFLSFSDILFGRFLNFRVPFIAFIWVVKSFRLNAKPCELWLSSKVQG